MSTGTLRQLRNWGQHSAQATRIANDRTTFTSEQPTQKVFNPRGGPATDGQKDFIRSLLDQLKVVNPGVWETAFNYVRDNRDMNSIRASDVITRLKAQVAGAPAVVTPTPKVDLYSDIVDGYYAVTADEGHTSFYRVATFKPSARYPRPGRKVQLQLSDALEPVSRAVRDVVLRKIREAGPDAAAMRYAREIGRCYRCGRTLTDAESRALGIGPTCRSK